MKSGINFSRIIYLVILGFFIVDALDAVDPPSLPSGLGGLPSASKPIEPKVEESSLELTGFVETRYGVRFKNAPGFSDTSLSELRTQVQWERELGETLLKTTADFLYDGESNTQRIDWESGLGWLDVRELNALVPASDILDLKIGRQVATWGVGDLVFINDLFPKDWNAFFLGRDVEYLKSPQDSVRASMYFDFADVELVYSPRFQADRFINGERLVYWDSASRWLTSEPSSLNPASPGDAFEADEIHLRASRVVGRYELAAYGYRGYWKSPAGVDVSRGRNVFPALSVYGASARGPLGKGLLSTEIGLYDSTDDPNGNDVFTRNSELRFLLGYEQEIGNELTGSVQYYVERTRDFGGVGDRDRDLVTLRLSKRLWQQTLTLNGFAFYSPSQKDHYIRLSASWKATDDWRLDIGANFFGGEKPSFFGQFDRNENVYLSVRRVF